MGYKILAKLKDFRICMECGSVFSKHIHYKIILNCTKCGNPHLETIENSSDLDSSYFS